MQKKYMRGGNANISLFGTSDFFLVTLNADFKTPSHTIKKRNIDDMNWLSRNVRVKEGNNCLFAVVVVGVGFKWYHCADYFENILKLPEEKGIYQSHEKNQQSR
jgi:hypothetical protein